VDAHKTLNAPYDCGLVLCRDRETLRAALRIAASYLPGDENRDGMQYTPEMSRRARAVELWATLKSLGKSGVQDLVDRLCRHAGNLAAGLRANGFNVLNEVVFNQVLAAGDGPDQTRAILDYIQKSGECWCGGTIWKGAPAIRISVCSWATTEADVERTLSTFVKARERAEARPKNR
jgi:glutamate/tyrosine decarboxylase-like PLP-dependent enzyme